MNAKHCLLPATLLMMPLLLGNLSGCTCGFDCNNDDDDQTGTLTFSVSDSLPEDLKQVVIVVNTLTFRRGSEEIVIDNFTDPNDPTSNTVSIDLLRFPGVINFDLISGFELLTGTYTPILGLLTNNENESFVKEADDTIRKLNVSNSNGSITLPNFTVTTGSQEYVAEFGLARALRYFPSDQTYQLTTEGVQVINSEDAGVLGGRVDSTLFDRDAPCSQKLDPDSGNRVYLYEGRDRVLEDLADVFTSSSESTPPANAVAPFAVAKLLESASGTWEYAFGYLPAGEYTIAFACNTSEDDPVNFDGLIIPEPSDQVYEVTLTSGLTTTCDITQDATAC
ncbi:MAG: DUF4382 domain-containing protein [Pseudomonadota bacterium]